MDLAAFHNLLTPAGQEALQAAAALEPREADFLRHYTGLCRGYPADLARAALEIAILRREAQPRFLEAERLYFTREALEQATPAAVAHYRAGRFAGFSHLADLGCSVGSDTLALARSAPVVGIDRDPLRLAMAVANLRACGLEARAGFVQADLQAGLPLARSPGLGLFFDPARRSGGRRLFSVRDYHPPLEIVRGWLPACPALGVKLSPGVDLQELAGYDAEIEFISLDGELKEAVLWFGPLKSAARRATLLPGPHTLAAPKDLEASPAIPLDAPRGWLYEPDPAVLRAGLVQDLAARLGAAQLDPEIAYLTGDNLAETPFARAWQVEAWFPFQLKRLRAALRQRGVQQVVVKKRGSPLDPQELIHALGVKEGRGTEAKSRVVVLTHLRGQPVVILCYPRR